MPVTTALMPDSAEFSPRASREQRYHDALARNIDLSSIDVDQYFSAATAAENKRAVRFFGDDFRGKNVLDIGSGYGEADVYFSKQGVKVWALDISPEMVNLGQQLAQINGVKIEGLAQPAERLPFPDRYFDFVFGNGVLHHIDFMQAGEEIKRVLKPDGRAAFIEPLPYNPIINVYRKMATAQRTPDEKPLSVRSISRFRKLFDDSRHEEYWLTALLIFIWIYIGERKHPNDVQYWKKIIYDADRYSALYRPLAALDRILTRIPLLRWFCWNTVILVQKT